MAAQGWTYYTPRASTRRWAFIASMALLLVLVAACSTQDPAGGERTAKEVAVERADTGRAPVEALATDEASSAVRLQLPEIGLDAAVTPMEWQVATIDGRRTTSWIVPFDSVGWHPDSAGAGAAGNTVLSGRQAGGGVFEALALGSVVAGQEVRLTDENGRVFIYEVREVSEPIPVSGATEEEMEQALEYVAPSGSAVLTLITGWPEFTTTHRVFAVADLVGEAE